MGRSPREIEDQVTYPLSRKLQGLAGVKAVRSSSEFNFSMITIIFDDNIDFYFARQRVTEKLAQASTFLPAGVVPYLAPDATALGPDFLVHGRGEPARIRSTPAELWALNKFYIAPQLNAAPGVADVAVVGGTPLEYQIDVRPEDSAGLRHHAGRSVRGRRPRATCPPAAASCRRTMPSTSSAASAGSRTRTDIENTVIKEVKGTPIYVKTVATVQLGTQFRRSVFEKDGNEVTGGAVLMRHGENPLAVTEQRQGEDSGAAAGPARRRAHRAGLRPHAADPRRHPHAHRGDVARNDHRLARDPADSDARPQRVRHLRHAAAGGAVFVPADVGACASLGIIDIQANIMSLAGITISIGILVDQAIVMTENATHHLKAHFGDQQGHGRHSRAGDRALPHGGPADFLFRA